MRLPDFLIVGAMKAGTTSLHRLLEEHPAIFMPSGEVHVHSIDDVTEHWPYARSRCGRWHLYDFDANRQRYLAWYAAHFEEASDGQLVGVDAPVYLSSPAVPRRIAETLPEARIIVMLRDPALRTYSAYWHMVRGGRMHERFEDALLRDIGGLRRRSHYLDHLRRYREALPWSRVHVVAFEEFVADPIGTTAGVLERLGVGQPPTWPLERAHSNPGSIAHSARLQRLRNRVLAPRLERDWGPLLPDRLPACPAPPRWATRLDALHRRVNPQRRRPPPRMSAATHRWLDDYYRRCNAGLDELVGREISAHWYHAA